jgi:tRNA G10  N-methylase Trm11
MKYAFVLGRVYTLSVAELFAVLQKSDPVLGLSGEPVKVLAGSPEVLVIETQKPLCVEKLQKRLGGVVKILEVVDIIKKREQDSINFALKHYFKPSVLKKQFFKEYKGKMQFGISIYLLDMDLAIKPGPFLAHPQNKKISFNSPFGEPKRIGMSIKKTLVDSQLSVRLVLPEFNSLALASVVVTKNLLLEKGAEICLLAAKDYIFTTKTITVQDFEDYGRRDYQRPVRDEKQGMIPPKVAQVMLNLSNCKVSETILDPFCGIGTIVQEGLLLCYKMLGSDINKLAVRGSEQNLEWFRNRYKIPPGKYHLETADAREISKLLDLMGGQKIDAVVTECTLGPMYGKYPKNDEIKANFNELRQLYVESFKEFSKFLSKGKRIVICIPAYKKGRNEYETMESLDWANELGYNQMDVLPKKAANELKFLKLTERNTAIYDRKEQIVAREIVIFEKILD